MLELPQGRFFGIVDIDFYIDMTKEGLKIKAFKSYDRYCAFGSHYTENTTAEIDLYALDEWLKK